MKRLVGLFIIFVMLISFTFVYADENEDPAIAISDNAKTSNESAALNNTNNEINVSESPEVDETTQNETEIMNNNFGVKVRLLQLQRAVQLRILWADTVINYLKEKNESVNVSTVEELESIVSEMNLIVNDIKSEISNLSDDPVRVFVDLKSDAGDLMISFRETASPYLRGEDRDELNSRFKEIERDSLKEITEQIKEQKRLFNAERIGKLSENIKKEKAELAEMVKNGELTAKQAIEQLKQEFKDFSEKQRERIKEKIKKMHVEARINRIQKIARVEENRLVRTAERLRERARSLATRAGNIANKISDEIDNKIQERGSR